MAIKEVIVQWYQAKKPNERPRYIITDKIAYFITEVINEEIRLDISSNCIIRYFKLRSASGKIIDFFWNEKLNKGYIIV